MSHFDQIRRLAFSLDAPNSVTPQLVQAANNAEADTQKLREHLVSIRAEFGWKRDGRELPELIRELRAKPEEAERREAFLQKVMDESRHKLTTEVYAERDAARADAERLREKVEALAEALDGLMAGCIYRDIQGDLDWHERTIPTRDALNAAREALAQHRGER